MSETNTVQSLRLHMIEDMVARKLTHTAAQPHQSCKRFAAWLKRSPDTATPDEYADFSCTSSRAVRASAIAIGS